MENLDIKKEEFLKLYHKFSEHMTGRLDTLPRNYTNPENPPENPPLIYHYTNLSSVIGIIENHCLWATNLYFLNDSKEYKHGMDIVTEVAREIKNEENTNILNAILSVLREISEVNRYVVSFSKEGDSLSQWRSYANNGGGISIGFNLERLKTALSGSNYFNSIIYNKERQRSHVKFIIEESTKFFLKEAPNLDLSLFFDLDFIGVIVSSLLDKIIATYKDPAFEEEKEYRVECRQFHNVLNIQADRLEIFYRTNEKSIIPYTKILTKAKEFKGPSAAEDKLPCLKITQFPIEKIIVGPSSKQEDIIEGVKHLLQNHCYNTRDIEISKSKIPYRS